MWHVFTVRLPDRTTRDAMQKHLEARGIGTLIFYPIPPHKQQAFAAGLGNFPIAEAMAETIISIPVSQVLTDDEVTEIIGAVNEFVG